MDNYKEEWRKIQGYEDNYEVSNLGRVRSIDRISHRIDGADMYRAGKVISSQDNGRGYLMVNLYKYNKGKRFYIHRLVAEAFIPNTNNLRAVDHINSNRIDNRPTNLEWVTTAENNRRAAALRVKNNKKDSKTITKPTGNGITVRKVIKATNLETGAAFMFNSMRSAERNLHLANGAVSQGIKNNWHYGGYKFELI